MRSGHRLTTANEADEVVAARRRFDSDLAWLPVAARRLADPEPVPVRRSARLITLRERLAAELRPIHSA
jgi:nicotinate phosphoribosyltransferase